MYSTTEASPPLQAIVTLNVTSSATLDLLLAALLDNTTGAWDGVNGTFASVTSQVASLGFDAPVLSALATAPIVSEGLYGTPPYKPTSHPSGGLWGEFWNAVSAVVTNPTGAILALVGEVWTVTLAVTTFLDHVAIEAAKIDGKLLSMSAAVLVSAWKVILAAVNEFVDYIISLLKAALGVIVTPLMRDDNSYAAGLNSTVTAISGSGGQTSANATAFWSAFQGSVFLVGLGMALTVEVAVTILLPFDLGVNFLIGIVLSLIVIGALYAAPQVSSVADQVSSAAIRWVQSIVNGSHAAPAIKDPINWNTFAFAYAFAASETTFPIGVTLLRDASDDEPLILPVAILTLDAMALGLEISSLIGQPIIAELALIVSAAGVALGLLHISVTSSAATATTEEVATLLAATGLGAAAYHTLAG